MKLIRFSMKLIHFSIKNMHSYRKLIHFSMKLIYFMDFMITIIVLFEQLAILMFKLNQLLIEPCYIFKVVFMGNLYDILIDNYL